MPTTRDEAPVGAGVVGVGAPSPAEGTPSPSSPSATRLPMHLAAIATYLALSLVLWAHVWFGGGPAHSITCNCGDTVQQVWWFEWLPWAVLHGHNPLLSNTLWARFGGVNTLSNTSWMAPATALAPVTLLFGPVASFNVANLLAPVLSGWAAFELAGTVTRRPGARLVAGAIYAFSPYVLRNTVLGHLDLTLTPYLPLVLLLGLRLLGATARPVRIGLLLGVLTILEFFTSLEVLALTAITGALCVVGALFWRPSVVARARRRITVAGAVGASLAIGILAYPTWFFLDGPRHVAGPFWPVSAATPQRIVLPGPDIFNNQTSLRAVGYLGAQGPNTDYLGAGILLALALSYPWWRRRPSCVILAAVGGICWVFEFLPTEIWSHLPLLSDIEQVRFALPVSLCAALLLAVSIDRWWEIAMRRSPTPGRRRTQARFAVFGVAVVALVPLIATYSVPFVVTNASVPAWFENGGKHLPPGTAVVTVPFSYGIESQPMGWQAETHDAFDLVGGWVFVPGGDGVHDEIISPLGEPVAAWRKLSTDPSGVTAAEQKVLRASLIRWRPIVVVVIPKDSLTGTTAALTATLGLSPDWIDGAWVWDLGATTRLGPVSRVAQAN